MAAKAKAMRGLEKYFMVLSKCYSLKTIAASDDDCEIGEKEIQPIACKGKVAAEIDGDNMTVGELCFRSARWKDAVISLLFISTPPRLAAALAVKVVAWAPTRG